MRADVIKYPNSLYFYRGERSNSHNQFPYIKTLNPWIHTFEMLLESKTGSYELRIT